MERLTQRVNDRLIMMKQDSGDNVPYYWDEGNFKVAEKLADYEDLEEQGLLVRVSRVKRRLEQFQKDLTSQTIYKEGLPGSALDIVNILIADLAADEGEKEG